MLRFTPVIIVLLVLVAGPRPWMVCRHPRGDFETDSCYIRTMTLLLDGRTYWRFRWVDGWVVNYPKTGYTISPVEE